MTGLRSRCPVQSLAPLALTLPRTISRLTGLREVFGFTFRLLLRLRMKTRSDSQPFLSNIRARLSVQDGVIHHIGEARCDETFRGAEQESSGTSALVWSDTFAALAHYERLRAGKPPRLTIEVHGQACYLVNVGGVSLRLRTEPVAVSGRAEIAYPAHVWVAMLRELKVAENVLVEVPVPGAPPPGREGTWQALVEARGAFEQGGETGWSQCVVKVRHALELWDNMEPEKKPLLDPPRGEWTKKDRLDGLRGHLRPPSCASGSVVVSRRRPADAGHAVGPAGRQEPLASALEPPQRWTPRCRE